MFKGPSENLKIQEIMYRPVEMIDPDINPGALEEKIRAKEPAVLLWPGPDAFWQAVLVAALAHAGPDVPVRDLAMRAFTVQADLPLAEVITLLSSSPEQAAVITDSRGNPAGLIEAGRMLALIWQHLLETECSVTTLMDTVNEAITVIDGKNTVIGWNRRAEELYHIPAQTIVGQEINRFFSSLVVTRVLNKDVVKKKGVRNDYHQPLPGTHVLINATPIVFRDRVLGSVCSERDITETVSLHNELAKASSEVRQLKNEIIKINSPQDVFQKIWGHSKKLRDTISLAQRVARTNVAILIRGESGTGKELFAEAVHNESSRRDKPFVVINCAAIPAALFESELFGYQSGAFTGADRKGRPGKFELAHQGTIFLDEIGELPLDLQVKLLRVLQNKQFYKVGGNEPIDVDVRVIAATHRNLEQMISDGSFREDLYYRINVVSLEIPPLRQRKEDIPELIYLFIREFCLQQNRDMTQMAPEVMTALLNYPWPGNIRELRNVVERMVILAEENMILEDHLPRSINSIKLRKLSREEPVNADVTLTAMTDRTERETILQALEGSRGDKSKAAKILGIPRSTLYYKLRKLDIK